MKPYTINCPSCGAGVNLEKDVPRCFCPYCGTQIIVDDGVQRSEIVYRDEAKILELQLKEQARIRSEEAAQLRKTIEEKKERKQQLKFPVAISVFFVMCFIVGLFFGASGTVFIVSFILSLVVPFFYPYECNIGFGKAALMYFGLFLLLLFLGLLVAIITSAFLAPVLHLRSIVD